ncbi:Reticulocyte-binding protein 2-like protein a [Frankliniella fusca]|uniref:Reticulocyte-binding protein 2-like protein a n=1 Tax=Frankliniella fusca TaxID=407009 RepID=A0AAE1HNV4_9NEOP|nr:Reticulocyte-binding protein 2-like protein a [Frankliniella fusca]
MPSRRKTAEEKERRRLREKARRETFSEERKARDRERRRQRRLAWSEEQMEKRRLRERARTAAMSEERKEARRKKERERIAALREEQRERRALQSENKGECIWSWRKSIEKPCNDSNQIADTDSPEGCCEVVWEADDCSSHGGDFDVESEPDDSDD